MSFHSLSKSFRCPEYKPAIEWTGHGTNTVLKELHSLCDLIIRSNNTTSNNITVSVDVLSSADDKIAERMQFLQNGIGAVPGPFDLLAYTPGNENSCSKNESS